MKKNSEWSKLFEPFSVVNASSDMVCSVCIKIIIYYFMIFSISKQVDKQKSDCIAQNPKRPWSNLGEYIFEFVSIQIPKVVVDLVYY